MMGQGDWNISVWYYDTWKEIWQFETRYLVTVLLRSSFLDYTFKGYVF